MIVIAGSVKIRPERREDAVKAAITMQRATRDEAGCISYRFHADLENPNLFHVFEEWDSVEALDAHFQTPHMAVFRQQLRELVAGEFRIMQYGVSYTKAM